MKRTIVKKISILLLCGMAVMFSCCSATEPKEETNTNPTFQADSSAVGIPNRRTKEEEKIAIFSKGAPAAFYWADGYSNGNQFNCTWKKSSAYLSDGTMCMSVKKEKDGYSGAEYRTDARTSYGFYSVCMKAAECSGVISSFFTYTHTPVWDEIDIEFLGKDTTSIQFNYYTKGVGNHEMYIDLGYNAANSFHEYAFDWRENSIVWYIDGIAVYKATENIPTNPMQMMMNVWNTVNVDEWSGALDSHSLPATAQYRWFAYSPN